MDRLEQFKLNVEEQIVRYSNNDNYTEEHKKVVIDKLNFVLDRIQIYELENEVKNK